MNKMIPTAQELWNDKKFIKRRIREQMDYQLELGIKYSCVGIEKQQRFRELFVSSDAVLIRFQNRLKQLNSGVA